MDFSSILLLLNINCFTTSLVTLLVLVMVFLYNNTRFTKPKGNKKMIKPPRLPGARPLLGHLHLFGPGELPHKVLSTMADKYGPAFTIKFGKHTTLVVSDIHTIKECLTTNDILFSNRPSSIAFDLMTYADDSVAFAHYSPYWRELRKISTLKLLSNNRLQSIKQLRLSEVNVCFKELYSLCNNNNKSGAPVLIDMKKWFKEVTTNIVIRVIVGKQNFGSKIVRGEDQEAANYKKIMDELSRLAKLSMFSDYAPLLSLFDYFRGNVSAMKRNGKELNAMLQNWLEEHKRKKNSSISNDDEQDFMDLMLSIIDETKLYGRDADTFIKAISLSMIVGGIDTVVVTLTWILALIMKNPFALKKAQEELDFFVGKERQVEDSDLKNLVYMNAIVKETLRLYPLSCILERDTKEDCEVGGYYVEGGTRLLINAWKLQRDPNVWTDPSEFKPERFLNENADIDVGGQHYELIPFGAGRRVCPGVSFALQFMDLVLARLIHGYELGTLNGEDVDLTEKTEGQINFKATPLDLIVTPRLHPNLYDY